MYIKPWVITKLRAVNTSFSLESVGQCYKHTSIEKKLKKITDENIHF